MRTLPLSRIAITTAALLCAATAHAELQTWRLTGTVYKQSGNVTIGWLGLGQDVQVDYLIQTDARRQWAGSDSYGDLVRNVSFNSSTPVAASGSYLSFFGGGGLTAINTSLDPVLAQGLDFISYNHFRGLPTNTSLPDALLDMSTNVRFGDVRFDLGNSASSWINVSSFKVVTSPVPELGVLGQSMAGLLAIAALGASGKLPRRSPRPNA